MKIDFNNYKNVPEKERNLIFALLFDIEDINKLSKKQIYIDWQDFHNEYSPERTDPCPDYYGYYTIRDEYLPNEIIGVEMTIDDLDLALCTLYNFVCEMK